MKIDWKSHFVELAVVFVGITLAFMLEGWRDASKQADLQLRYLQSFQHELGLDEGKLDSLVQRAERTGKEVTRLRDLLIAETPVHMDTVTALFSGAMVYSQLPRNRSTYTSITASGNLSLIADYALRQSIVEYYQLLETSEIVTQVNNRYVDDYLMPLFIDHLDFVASKWLPEDIVQTPRFRNVVIGSVMLQSQSIASYHDIQTKRDALAGRVDSVLARP